MPHRVLIIDDHQIMRDGLRLLIASASDLEYVGHAFDTDGGWKAVQELAPDVVVMDLNIPGTGGLELTARIRQAHPRTKIVVLTGQSEARCVREALRIGAHGYVLKTRSGAELLAAMRAVAAGQIYLCPEATTLVVQQYQARQAGRPGPALSAREREVWVEIAAGASTKEIAYRLGLGAKTIETHRANLMKKLGVGTIAELTKLAVREGLSPL